ncbi:MAG: hypothetical protein OHK0029_00490 [Armatimonadaceae bacterium]
MTRKTLLSLLLLPVALPVSGQPPLPDGASDSSEKPVDPRSPLQKFHLAEDLLVRGQRFERAAELLREVLQAEPENFRAASLLACACVSRVVSLAYTLGFIQFLSEDRRTFPERLRQWEEAQKDPESDGYGDPRPVPLPEVVLKTKDDNQPFTLSETEFRERVSLLLNEAVSAWTQAKKTAATSEEQAEAAYLRGWCMRIVANGIINIAAAWLADGSGETHLMLPLSESVNDKEALACFVEATEKAPENALYWRARGDADDKNAVAWYQKSLALQPRQPLLWYKLYNREFQKGFRPASMASICRTSTPGRRFGRRTGTENPKKVCGLGHSAALSPHGGAAGPGKRPIPVRRSGVAFSPNRTQQFL